MVEKDVAVFHHLAQGLGNHLRVILLAGGRNEGNTQLGKTGAEHRAVGIVDFSKGELFPRLAQLIPGAQQRQHAQGRIPSPR